MEKRSKEVVPLVQLSRLARRAPRHDLSRGRRIRRFLTGLLAVILGLGLMGFLYQAAASAIDIRRFPPPGQLVEVGGHRLHIRCAGEGSPTVLFEAGAGGSMLDWALVDPRLAGLTRLCLYDRAGLGWSDPGPEPRTAEQVARELHTLLERAGEEGPFVLVAHSLGGVHAQVFAGLYPDQVKGLVLVDPTAYDPVGPTLRQELTPDEVRLLEEATAKGHAAMGAFARATAWLSRFGILRAASLVGLDPVGAQTARLPEELRPTYRAIALRTGTAVGGLREVEATATSLQQAAGVKSLGSMPILLLRPAPPAESGSDSLPPGFTPELMAKLRRIKQVDPVLTLSSRAREVEVAESGHYIQLDQPQAVEAAIREIVAEVRR